MSVKNVIDLSKVSGDEAADILRSEIERLGLDIQSARIVVDGVKCEKPTRAMTYTFHFELDQERAK